MSTTVRVHLDDDVYESLERYATENKKGENVSIVAIGIIEDFLKERGY